MSRVADSADSLWFRSGDTLLSELRRGQVGAEKAPALAGYDDLREIGRGGQAVVFVGIQRSTKRRAAIKLLHDSFVAAPHTHHRFERETEIVAGFQHPYIPIIYDSGLTGDGRAYCVMEYVEGVPLDEWVKGTLASEPGVEGIRRVLSLFVKVCEGVNYAHQRGVIHRDIKPGNVRVTKDGTPRILDFGLAKHETRNPGQVSVTETGQFVGSLQWSSPEQVDGRPMDIRSDVYSLGVMLYQLLTGKFPYPVNGSLREITNAILNHSPAAPSIQGEAVDSDLHTILIRGLAKSPADRYQTAGEFGADVTRYLTGEPIEARRDSGWIAIRKTLGRYRAMIAIAMILLLVSTVVAVSMGLLYRRATQAEATAVAEAKRASREADKAKAVNEFMSSIFSSVNPSKMGYRVTVAEALDRAADEVRGHFANDPEIEAAVETSLGEAYMNIGLRRKCTRHFKRALELRERTLGPSHPDTLISRENYALQHTESGMTPDASIAEFQEIAAIRRELFGPKAEVSLRSELQALSTQVLYGRPQAELGALWALSDRIEEALGPTHTLTILAQCSATRLEMHSGQFASAEKQCREILTRLTVVPDPEHRDKLMVMDLLCEALIEQRKYAEAEPTARFASEVKRRVLGGAHPATLPTTSRLVHILCALDRTEEARALAEQTLSIAREQYVEEATDESLIGAQGAMAMVLAKEGRIDEMLGMLPVPDAGANGLHRDHRGLTLDRQLTHLLELVPPSARAEAEARLKARFGPFSP